MSIEEAGSVAAAPEAADADQGRAATFRALIDEARPSHSRDGECDWGARMADLGIDSLAVVNLVVRIEDEFEIVFPRHLLLPHVFASPASLWEALSAYLRESEGP